MRLTVLGAAAPFPRPDQPCSGYLLRGGGCSLWVDCGPGTFSELQRHVALTALDALWLSHLHADHSGDLPVAYYAYAFDASLVDARPVVMGPPGWTGRMAAFVQSDVEHDMTRTFRAFDLFDGYRLALGGMELVTRSVSHNIQGFGLRVDVDGVAFAYSGDSGECAALLDLARGAEIFLCEAGESSVVAGETPHCTPEQAASIAREAGAGTLVLTHLAQDLSTADAVRRAATIFKGPLLVAYPGLEVEVGSP